MLFVTEDYLDSKKTKSEVIKKNLNRIEMEVHRKPFLEAKQLLISIGGLTPKYDLGGSFKTFDRYHFRPNGTGNAHRVIYGYRDNFTKPFTEGGQISSQDIIFYQITEEADHDKRQIQIAKQTCSNENEYIYHPLLEGKEDIVETTNDIEETVQTYYGFPIDQNQKNILTKEYPMMVIGSAGSGKTVTALELYKQNYLQHKDLKIAFVTMTRGLKNKVQDELLRCGFENTQCFTFAEFSGNDYIDMDYFINLIEVIINDFLDDKFDKGVFSKLAQKYSYLLNKVSVYTIVRGFFKGRLNSNENYRRYTIEQKDTLKEELIKSENLNKFLDEDTKKVVDYLWKIYETYEKRKKHKDDNDFNPENLPTWDCIIVDEIQDLTEIQVDYLIKSCNSTRLYFYGDPNQTINPTFFSFSRIEGLIKHRKQLKQPLHKELLKETYRSGKFLIEYINHLSDIRKETIGTQSDAWDEHEKSLLTRKDDKWACVIKKEESLDDLFRLFRDSDDCIIIVNDEENRQYLKNQFKDMLGLSNLIFLISEIKGLEHKNIIAYNIISDNQTRFEEILSLKYKKSTAHRMIFNRYYVALTRAKESVIICETKIPDSVYEKMFKYEVNNVDHIVEMVDNQMDLVENYISKSTNPDAFVRSGDRFKENGLYIQAKEKYEKAFDLASDLNDNDVEIEKIHRKLHIVDLMLKIKKTTNGKEKNEIAESLILLDENRLAIEIFNESKNTRGENVAKYIHGEQKIEEIINDLIHVNFQNQGIYKIILESNRFEEDMYQLLKKYAGGILHGVK